MTYKTTRASVFYFLVFFLSWPLSAIAELPTIDESVKSSESSAYQRSSERLLEPGDRVKVTIYPPDPYITGGEIQVSSEGNITLALVGKVFVKGMTLVEVERKLVEIIDADYIIDPEVVVELETVKVSTMSVSVLGAVKTPGSFEVEAKGSDVTLIHAILKAGGFSEVANIKKIKIVRKGNNENEVIRVNAEKIVTGEEKDLLVEDGDIIHVAESLF